MVMRLHGCLLHPLLVNQSAYHCTMDDVHTFEGVRYIHIKVIRIKSGNGFLLVRSQSTCPSLGQKKKPTEIGLSVMPGLGNRAGEHISCLLVKKPLVLHCSPFPPLSLCSPITHFTHITLFPPVFRRCQD